jgi:hypothetical protein
MKRTVIILSLIFALAIALSVGIPSLAATSGTDVVTITGHVNAVIEVSPTTNTIALGDLTPSAPLTPVTGTTTVTVKCNAGWTLTATDTTTPTAGIGYMTNGAVAHLTNYLIVSSNGGGSPSGNLASPLILNTGTHTSGTATLVTVSQTPDWADAAGSYAMTMTLTGTTP